MILSTTIAILVAGAVYLVLQRSMVRVIFGMSLMSHAANLLLLAGGVGAWRGEAFVGMRDVDQAADPLPQAFVLTAIVIAMATTTILLATAALGADDDTEDEGGHEGPGIDDGTPDVHETADPFSTLGRDSQRAREVKASEKQARRARKGSTASRAQKKAGA
ncbi:cation:proton antiporter subunit C [Corynebacterium tapiri]|uniref:Cation:proton antiporter n=1 Tax=Corynebacterium tapiri TaxID=1448266 RepID=A0A5C4U377_9CORY|nr:cation:proton antiporter subunit C [Corynebacterium tapiri]TNL97367.1 cation:proton antiporter [Corynebacterium tapiri]